MRSPSPKCSFPPVVGVESALPQRTINLVDVFPNQGRLASQNRGLCLSARLNFGDQAVNDILKLGTVRGLAQGTYVHPAAKPVFRGRCGYQLTARISITCDAFPRVRKRQR